jgi:hypothetical protein
MLGRDPDRRGDEHGERQDVAAPPEAERPDPSSDREPDGEADAQSERHRAETDTAAGDVADDLADFA